MIRFWLALLQLALTSSLAQADEPRLAAARREPNRTRRLAPPPAETRPEDPADLAPIPEVWTLTELPLGRPGGADLHCLARSAGNPDVLYAAGDDGLVYVSRDGGRSWDIRRLLIPRSGIAGSYWGMAAPALIWLEEPSYDMPHCVGDAVKPSAILNFLEPLEDEQVPELEFAGADEIRETIDDTLRGARYRAQRAPRPLTPPELDMSIRTSTPWLARAVADRAAWTASHTSQQTLIDYQYPTTGVLALDVDPHDADAVWAVTDVGLLRSLDGGFSWRRVFDPATGEALVVGRLYRPPGRSDELWATSEAGVLVARGGSERFEPLSDRLAESACTCLAFHPRDRALVYVGSSDGLLRSRDGGGQFETVSDAGAVSAIAIDLAQPDRLLLATDNGLLRSVDGGASWEPAGGSLFADTRIVDASAGSLSGQFVVATERDLWETRDSGASWRAIAFGAGERAIVALLPAAGAERRILVVTRRHLLQLAPVSGATLAPELLASYWAAARREPTASEAVELAVTRAQVDFPTTNALRHRARWAGLVPSIRAGFRYVDVAATGERTHLSLVSPTPAAGSLPPPVFGTRALFDHFFGGVGARWDLDRMIHDSNETPANWASRQQRDAWAALRTTVLEAYAERRRLQLAALVDPGDARARIQRALRLEELTALLNLLTGDAFPPESARAVIAAETEKE